MDTNKIREELESLKREIAENGSMWPVTKDSLNGRIDAILAELDKAPKVLTNEEAGRITDYVYRNGLDGVPKNEIAMAKAGFNFGLRYARDNGYLCNCKNGYFRPMPNV